MWIRADQFHKSASVQLYIQLQRTPGDNLPHTLSHPCRVGPTTNSLATHADWNPAIALDPSICEEICM
jgi:hypothetical protein